MITERDIDVLRAVARYYVLSRAQIQALCFQDESGTPLGSRVVRRRLQALVDGGYLRRLRLAVYAPGAGAPAPVYYPSRKGCELLAVHLENDAYYSVPTRPPQAELALHWLAISEIHVRLDQAIARQREVSLIAWHNEHDQIRPDATKPEDKYRLYTLIRQAPRLVCAPDAGFLLASRGHAKAFYLEADRNTSGVRQIAASKTQGYAVMAELGLHRRHFPTTTLPTFTVLMVTTDSRRRDALRREIAKKPGADLWKFTTASDLTAETFLFAPVLFSCRFDDPVSLVKPAPAGEVDAAVKSSAETTP